MKRMISIVLIVACLLTCLPLSAAAETGGKLIALTFDDGPGPYTDRLLDGLARRGIHATFFTLGMRAETYGKEIRRMYAEGHQIANHSYNHPNLNELSNDEIRWQIQHTSDILNDTIGQNFHYIVRPPYGNCNDRVASLLNAPAIIWSVDPNDWKDRNAYTVRNRVVSQAHDGAIILCHDIYSTSVNGILMAVDTLLEEGYEFVTVNELFRRRGVTLQNGRRYYSMKPNGTDLGPVDLPEVHAVPKENNLQVSFDLSGGPDVYYTTDGSDPVTRGLRYTEAFSLGGGKTLKYFAAFALNGSRTETVTQPMENLLPAPEIHTDGKAITIENQMPAYGVHYTTDGTEPGPDSPAFEKPIACYDGVLRFCRCIDGRAVCQNRIYVSKNGNLFWDVPSDAWYFPAADRAVTLGMFNGVGTYQFAPEEGLTRAMFVTVLWRLMKQQGKDVTAGSRTDFTDLTEDWYMDAMHWAAENQIVRGYEDHTARPDSIILREEMCVILDRTLTWLGVTKEKKAPEFADADQISDWAKDSVKRVSGLGLILGKAHHCFEPQETASRAEAATVLLRLYDLLSQT